MSPTLFFLVWHTRLVESQASAKSQRRHSILALLVMESTIFFIAWEPQIDSRGSSSVYPDVAVAVGASSASTDDMTNEFYVLAQLLFLVIFVQHMWFNLDQHVASTKDPCIWNSVWWFDNIAKWYSGWNWLWSEENFRNRRNFVRSSQLSLSSCSV